MPALKKAGGGAKASAPSATRATPRQTPGKKPADPPKEKKDSKAGAGAAEKGKGKKGTKDSAEAVESASSSVTATGGAAALLAAKVVSSSGPGGQKKIEYLSEELMNRKPLEGKAKEQLVVKCGPAVQEVHFVRNENKPVMGRIDDLAPSRHERIPPSCVVLMFNAFESSFDLAHGDLKTLPESETCELRSLTSGKVLGRVKISPEKGTPFEERVVFNNDWYVGSEHGLVHDGLQADGSLDTRLDWRDSYNDPHVAIIRANPWLAYGCGEGARIAVRKPGALEGTAATVQRALRDDHVVVRRDGTDGELTVDPTPFTMVYATNPRHLPGARLLLVHEGSCVDAMVEAWADGELDVKDGSRHKLKVESKHMSGWVTMVTKDGQNNMSPLDGDENEGDTNEVWMLTRKKTLGMHSGCDPLNSEKMGAITSKMALRVIEKRETEEYGLRAYVSSIPSQSAINLVCALNEYNHSVQRFPSVAEYEAARANYCEDIVVREALVEDAITGNNLRIKDQTLHISTATDAQDNSRPIPPEWNVTNVLDLVKLLLVPSPNRVNGCHSTQPTLVRAGPGTGKTWMAKQAVFTLADKLLRGAGANDGIRLVPIVVFVQRIIYLLRESGGNKGERTLSLLERYIESVYSGKKMEAWQTMLMQAYEMRALVVLLDGVDEAAGLRDQIEDFVHKEIVPSGNRVLVTSRPEGVKLSTYAKTFVVMNLCSLTNEQQRRVINIQMQGNIFFDHLLSLGEVRKMLDDAYRKISPSIRGELEALWATSLWRRVAGENGESEWDPDERQMDAASTRVVLEREKIFSNYLRGLHEQLAAEEAEGTPCLLEQLQRLFSETPDYVEGEFETSMLALVGEKPMEEVSVLKTLPRTLVRLGQLMVKEAAATRARLAEEKAKGKAAKATEAITAVGTWARITSRTDEIYAVHEAMAETFKEVLHKLLIEVSRDDEEVREVLKDLTIADYKDPVRLHDRASELFAERFTDSIPEACVYDISRARVALPSGGQVRDFVQRLMGGLTLSEATVKPVKPSERAEEAEREAEREAAKARGEPPPPTVLELKCMHLVNKFGDLDPTHFRQTTLCLKLTRWSAAKEPVATSIYAEIEIHFSDILTVGSSEDTRAYEHYNFFRKRLKGSVPEGELDMLLEEKLVFLVDATGVPVLLSLLVLIFTAGGEDLTKLPSNRIELYELGIESAIAKRLLPGGRTSTDTLIHDWLRLFNLDRSAMTAALQEGATEKKEREHRPTRKAGLSQEHNFDMSEKKMEKEAEAATKKKASENTANKGDKKLLNLDAKEVYEVFRHGSHYLREAAKPEVQRTELNRIELSMPKKLVDTVMMLVNANLKMLLGDRARSFGLSMLRHVAVSNQMAGRREFSAAHVAQALLVDQVNTEGITLWMHLNKEEGGLPLIKTLEAQTELAPAQYQFKHLSFQEGLFAQHLLIQAEAGWETWETDETAAEFLNNPFMNNTCRIAAGFLGTRLSRRRPRWDFSEPKTRLTEVGLQALWLICEFNMTLSELNLQSNGVGRLPEDGVGLARMLTTSTALVTLTLSSNVLGELKGYIRSFGRGLAANKTLTQLDVSNNRLLPDGIKVVCNALRSCTAMKDLNLSYNSPGREPALSAMLLMHPTLRSVGVIEKEPTTRSERTWWLDTRGKEAIGRALLDSEACTVAFLQCDVFSLTETTETLNWTSRAPCDAIVLAGVMRCNSVLKTLNLTGGDVGDYEREEIGKALLTNNNGRVGYCDIYGLKENMAPSYTVDLKNKEQIRSRRSFTLFAGLLRANSTLTSLTLSSVVPEHIDVLAEALQTNTTIVDLKLEQPNKATDTAITTLPVQLLNGSKKLEVIDLFDCGGSEQLGPQPIHRHACGVVGAILATNQTVRKLKMNPGGGSEGGAILEHLHRARKSSLVILDLTGIGLAERGGAKFFETLLAGKCGFLKSLHLGSNKLTDLAVGPLIVEVLRSDTCNITTLDLNDNQIGAAVITQAIKYNKSLTNLDIRECPVEDEGLATIGGLLLEADCPCHMRYVSCDAFAIRDGATELKIHDATLGAGATKLLCGVFKYNNLIKQLDLSGRNIEVDAAPVLATAVAHNTTLKSLDLSNNPLCTVSLYTGKDGADTKGLTKLADAVKASVSLDALTLEGGKLPVEQLKGEKKTRLLDLSRKNLGFVSAIFIGTLLRGNHQVSELVIHSNDLTPTGATIIVEQLSPSVKTLDLANIVRVEDRNKADKKADKGKSSVAAAKAADIPPEELVGLWHAVSNLGSLEKLTLDKDYMKEISSMGKLHVLKQLSVSYNKLKYLPKDIVLLSGLKSLTLHGNQLRELHSVVGELDALEKLDLRSNQLTFLPTSLSKLRNLKQLDASENLIQTLHPSICDLHSIEKLEVKDNPLIRPPAAVARQGLGAIRKHFQEIVMTGEIASFSVKMLLIGHGGAGKSWIERGLRQLTHPMPLPLPADSKAHEPTNIMDFSHLVLGEGARQMGVSIWDLAGDPRYEPLLQPYIVPASLYLLAVPALPLDELSRSSALFVDRWLDLLQMNAPNAIVLPVVTKCDMLPSPTGARDTSPMAVANAAAAHVAWLKERVAAHQAKQPPGGEQLRIQDEVQCVFAVTDGHQTMDGLRDRIASLVFSDPPLLPSAGCQLNRTMVLSTVFLRAMRDGRDPIDSARAADLGYIPSTMSTEVRPMRRHMSFEQLRALYTEEFAPALKLQFQTDPASALNEAIKLLSNQGEMAVANGGLVYLHPGYIVRLKQALCDLRMGNRLWYTRELGVQDTLRAALYGTPLTELDRSTAIGASETLMKEGELCEELMPTLWESTFLQRDEYGDMLKLLTTMGVVVLTKNTKHGRRWHMPMRSPYACDAAAEAMAAGNARAADELLSFSIALGSIKPAGLLERLIGCLYGLGELQFLWGAGALLEVDRRGALGEGLRLVLVEFRKKAKAEGEAADSSAAKPGSAEADSEAVTVELIIEGLGRKASRTDNFATLRQLKQLAQSLMDDIPGLASLGGTSMHCPGCLKRAGRAGATTWLIDELTARKQTCEQCSEVVSLSSTPDGRPINMLGALAMPLLLEPPVTVPEAKLVSDKLQLGRPLETLFSLGKQLGLAEGESGADKLRVAGEAAILDEFTARARSLGDGAPKDANGWTDLDWLRYVSAAWSAKPPVRSTGTPRQGSGEDEAIAEKEAALQKHAAELGIDAGRKEPSLDYFMKRPVCVSAGLSRGHLLALRLYTTGAFRRINMALASRCDDGERRHPYPATCVILNDALSRLRNAQVEQRRAAVAKAASLAEEARKAKDGDDEEVAAKAAHAAKDAAAASKALEVDTFWRGVCGVPPPEFKLRGGTELGFLSVTKDRSIAQQQALESIAAAGKASRAREAQLATEEAEEDAAYADEDEEVVYLPIANWEDTKARGKDKSELPVVLLKTTPLEAEVPADLSFLSVDASLAEFAYPPGVYLEQRKETNEYFDASAVELGIVQGKVIEVIAHMTRASTMKAIKKDKEKAGAQDGKAAAPAAA